RWCERSRGTRASGRVKPSPTRVDTPEALGHLLSVQAAPAIVVLGPVELVLADVMPVEDLHADEILSAGPAGIHAAHSKPLSSSSTPNTRIVDSKCKTASASSCPRSDSSSGSSR